MTTTKKIKAAALKSQAVQKNDLPAVSGRKTDKSAAVLPVVGIGASAGGLAAFEAFFSGMPADSNPDMAFVLVQHLAPDHKSILTDIIQRYTRMRVFEVEDGMKVKSNCVYIIPPNSDMALFNGELKLLEPSAPHGQRLPIDFFFRSLAEDQHERAIGIVLSGTGSDGTLGVRAIKDGGGLAMAQSLESTEYDGMPRSAIDTGMVDYELSPGEMPSQLISYVAHAFGKLQRASADAKLADENILKKVFILLRTQTGHDFSHYKPSTIIRRIERRMAIHQIETMEEYVKFLQQTNSEVEALFRDMLIGVTNFFRDTEAFKALEEQVIPELFSGKPSGGFIRVWVPGCSTGEEAYSIAILLREHLDPLRHSFNVQVFATDIDSRAIVAARSGIYPASIAADISPERLARFFSAEPGGVAYRVHKNIRDMLIFSEQDVIKDPPFSTLDLISCRNLMIYMGGELQKKLIPLFHYALNSGSFLFLGTSETVGEFSYLFKALDRKAKIYQRKDDFSGAQHVLRGQFMQSAMATSLASSQKLDKPSPSAKLPLRELTEQALMQQIVQVGALVNSCGDILYLHGRTGMYLEPAPGESGVNNILKMAREGLRNELTIALRQTASNLKITHCPGLRIKINGRFCAVNLTVRPVTGQACFVPGRAAVKLASPLFLIILEEATEQLPTRKVSVVAAADDANPDVDARIVELKQELQSKEEYLQAANEELKSSNEEMQSVNEELQSTNEELETSKEELQSINEELSTVNAELQTKVADLSRANNDMNNLLGGTGIATVFVNHQLIIMRFTPAATKIINLILNDIGRPMRHIASNLVGYGRLEADTQAVLDTLIPKELEVQTIEGKWYSMHIQPYRTIENVIEGAVITFFDITEIVQTRKELRSANELLRLAVVVRDARDAITVHNLDGRILAWNAGAERIYGWSEAEALAMNVRDLIPEELRKDELSRMHQLSQAEILEPYHTRRVAKDGAIMEISMTATALVNETGKTYAIATTERRESSPAAKK